MSYLSTQLQIISDALSKIPELEAENKILKSALIQKDLLISELIKNNSKLVENNVLLTKQETLKKLTDLSTLKIILKKSKYNGFTELLSYDEFSAKMLMKTFSSGIINTIFFGALGWILLMAPDYIIKYVIDHIDNINEKDGTEWELFHNICACGNVYIVTYLVEHVVDLEQKIENNFMSEMICRYSRPDVIQYLLPKLNPIKNLNKNKCSNIMKCNSKIGKKSYDEIISLLENL